ncbi:DUF3078 domain-containing protein [Saccharicrinis fermentans]|uniref:DUF3078 domain-containing protein n=1 Tax=Saccharicrinis fermentans DSM 9555 = JCM 21142 TaxID=869213 RepID=W7XXI5_9BACT|nr:DUF3078 domain-containing protein [Saccharicrinis fermentans]GAF03150.1 hypothetical protein JCM21142_41814 [Saccharicrinis fermentans DSM 9555 = JCM 21142]
MKFFHHIQSSLSISFIIILLAYGIQDNKAQTLDQAFDIAIKNIKKTGNLSDTIKKRSEYWSSLHLDHRFFIVDSTRFAKNQIRTLNPDYWQYKDYVMSLKFYPNPDMEIKYKPTLIKEQLLYTSKGYFDILNKGSDFDQMLGPLFNSKKKNEEFFINHPKLVKHVWKTIPEPHRLITDRKHLARRSAREGIERLLSGKVDSPNKLDKRIKKNGPWTMSGIENIQFSQAHLVNWAKGGENTIALQSDLLLKANYKKDKIEWENYGRHKVGILSSESYEAQVNTDQITANSKYGIKASQKWYYSGVFDFKTQFFNGYNNKDRETIISGFMSPAYFTFAIGMDYKPNKNFTLLLSPITSKITYVKDNEKVDPTRYNVDEDKHAAYNTGASIVNNLNWNISTELNLKSQLEGFIGYAGKDALTQVDWELTFDMRINRFLSTRINTQLRYFTNEADKKIQFKENFAVNFSYKF